MNFTSILIAIVIFSLLVFFHELGHFLAAKACGIGVVEFSIGMGPRLFSFKKGETRYSLKAIPFGGSCAMVGEDAAGGGEIERPEDITLDDLPDNSFQKKSVWARMITVAAGPLFNFILAMILGIIMVACIGTNPPKVTYVAPGSGAEDAGIREGDTITSVNGYHISIGYDFVLFGLTNDLSDGNAEVSFIRDGKEHTVSYDPSSQVYRTGISYTADENKAVLSEVTEGLPAYNAGLRAGDVITAVDGVAISSGEELGKYFSEHPMSGQTVRFTYERNGKSASADVASELVTVYELGFSAVYYREKATFLTAISGGFHEMTYGIKAVFSSLKMLFTGAAGINDLSGPVGIVSAIGKTIDQTKSDGAFYVFVNMLNISILLSANLGIVNLFPLPALDGGRLIALIFEAITRKRMSMKVEGAINMAGFAVLMALMVYILVNDIIKLFI